MACEKGRTLPAECRHTILKSLGLADEDQTAKPAGSPDVSSTPATEFSVNEMRKFLGGVKDKTRTLLTEIAKTEARFNVGEVLARLGWKMEDIRGVQSGITKRTRTISGDADAEFFASVVWDDDINKCISEVHPSTHTALRVLLLAQ
jgi:hypothetical protein